MKKIKCKRGIYNSIHNYHAFEAGKEYKIAYQDHEIATIIDSRGKYIDFFKTGNKENKFSDYFYHPLDRKIITSGQRNVISDNILSYGSGKDKKAHIV